MKPSASGDCYTDAVRNEGAASGFVQVMRRASPARTFAEQTVSASAVSLGTATGRSSDLRLRAAEYRELLPEDCADVCIN